MDPITHTFTGAALSAAGLRRATPLAGPALVLAANAPDIDIVSAFVGNPFTSLAFRRGWTHGPLAWVLLPLVVAGVVLAYDRWLRRRRRAELPPARAGPLVVLAAIGVATHPFLDWLNNYGLRWLMPFDSTWSYGDALFIVDPWVWLLLGGALFLGHSQSLPGLVAWAAFAAAATWLVLAVDFVPAAARVLWVAGLAALVVARVRTRSRMGPKVVRLGLAAVAGYILLAVAADAAARREVRAAAIAAGVGPLERIMVAPVPADPLGGMVVVATAAGYHYGSFHWLQRPRATLEPQPLPAVPPGTDAIIAASRSVPEARDYLTWARFPFYRVTAEPDGGYRVRIGDARYETARGASSLRGLEVRLDAELRPVARQPRD